MVDERNKRRRRIIRSTIFSINTADAAAADVSQWATKMKQKKCYAADQPKVIFEAKSCKKSSCGGAHFSSSGSL